MNNDENYPESRKDGTFEEIFGVTVEDQYRWLEDFTRLNLPLGSKIRTNLLKNT
ncbi:hypothetical protein Ct9H90mP29_22920 [bacterium]|nr:MAG: hypothetical protein Ct9H90mP29_22920 [bacterium]